MRININKDEIALYANVLDESNNFIPMVSAADDDEGWYEIEFVIDTMPKYSRLVLSGVRGYSVIKLDRPIRVYKKGLKIVFGAETPEWVWEMVPREYKHSAICG